MLSFNPVSQNRLAELLDNHAVAHSTMRLDEAQAFMLALLSGPDEVAVEDWLPEILGDAEWSEAESQEIRDLVLQMTAHMKSCLLNKKLPDLLLYEDEYGENDYFTWCNAYIYALDIVPTDWFEKADNEEFEDLFYPLMAMAGVYDDDDGTGPLLDLSERELRQLESDLPHVLLDIYLFWQAVLNKPTTVRREGDKVGRNDPCPCESGKKYKACCGKC